MGPGGCITPFCSGCFVAEVEDELELDELLLVELPEEAAGMWRFLGGLVGSVCCGLCRLREGASTAEPGGRGLGMRKSGMAAGIW